MWWKFWKPRHTPESVARRILEGLEDGSIVLDAVGAPQQAGHAGVSIPEPAPTSETKPREE